MHTLARAHVPYHGLLVTTLQTEDRPVTYPLQVPYTDRDEPEQAPPPSESEEAEPRDLGIEEWAGFFTHRHTHTPLVSFPLLCISELEQDLQGFLPPSSWAFHSPSLLFHFLLSLR